jgi:hypothetical protein
MRITRDTPGDRRFSELAFDRGDLDLAIQDGLLLFCR